MYQVPILFIIFKRKDVALKTLKAIKAVRPVKIYIAGDGARLNVAGEKKKVEETRNSILKAIDWDCEVKTLFQKENLGCSAGVYTAINWLFENEDRGIILEDDCVMQKSFFPFAEELLEKYKDDERIGMIDGANYISLDIPFSYGFSKYKSTNGWATWRRAWKNMDMNMKWRNTPIEKSIIANMGYRSKDVKYWKYRIKSIDKKVVSAWDWQWYFTLASQNQLGIYPNVSLQTNIGFGVGATHTTSNKTPEQYITYKEIEFPLRHPEYIVPFEPFERAFYHQNETLFERIKELFPIDFKTFIKKLLKK